MKKIIYAVLACFAIYLFVSNGEDSNKTSAPKMDTVKTPPPKDRAVADKKEYRDQMIYYYNEFYKKYNPLECSTAEYKGYLFVKCYTKGSNDIGGLYVVDDTKTNADGRFDIYTINGKAISQREVMIKTRGNDIKNLKELPRPYPQWINIDEVNDLISSGKDYSGEYQKASLFKNDEVKMPAPVEKTSDEPIGDLSDSDKDKIVKEAGKVTFTFLDNMRPSFFEYMKRCLDNKLPNVKNLQNSKCSFFDRDRTHYKDIASYIDGELNSDNMDSLDENYFDAYTNFADTLATIKDAEPKLYESIKKELRVEERTLGATINLDTSEVDVSYAVNNLMEVLKKYNIASYKNLDRDGILYLKCIRSNDNFKCKILPKY